MSLKESIASNAALEQIHKLKLSASRHFHTEVTELLLRAAPSSMSFTCIGVENARAYSYLRSAGEREGAQLLPARWTFRLGDLLPAELRAELSPQHPHVVSPAQMGPLFESVDRAAAALASAAAPAALVAPAAPGARDRDGRVLLVILESSGVVSGVAGLERSASEPPFSSWELAEVGALIGALSLAATYVLTVELLAFAEIATKVSSGRSSLLMLADHQARQIIWASSSEQVIDWERDVLPQQRWLFEEPEHTSSSSPSPARPTELHELELGGARCSVLRVPSAAEPTLSRREREVAALLVGGYANLNIAAHLGISENTTRTYIRRLYKKLGVCNRIDLIRAYEAAG